MSEFKEWFLNQYKYCEEYFEITTFEDGKFKPVKSYHPEHQDTANLLNVALNAWNYQQAKVDELQKYNDDLAKGQWGLLDKLKKKDKQIQKALDCIGKFSKEGGLFLEWLVWAEKALRGEHEDFLSYSEIPNSSFEVDWSQAPEGFNWWAVDEDGRCHWFIYKPRISNENREFDVNFAHIQYDDQFRSASSFNYTGDWKDSLRERPKNDI